MQLPFNFDTLSTMHGAGVHLGKTIAVYGAGFSLGKNIIRVIRGKERGAVAFSNVIRDTIIFFGVSYVGGALLNGAINVATVATGKNIAGDVGAMTSGVTSDGVGQNATALSGAAGDLVDRVTSGLVGMIGSAGAGVGSTLTAATADTSIGGTVAAFVGTFGTLGSATGSVFVSIGASLLFGAVIGAACALIFDR